MALRSDFTTILVNEHLGDKVQDLNIPWAQFVGNQTIPKNFEIDGNPRGKAYLLVQAFGVEEYGHKILINGTDLSGDDLMPEAGGWQTWMKVFDSSILKPSNTLQIVRNASKGNNFVILNVVIHWRESD